MTAGVKLETDEGLYSVCNAGQSGSTVQGRVKLLVVQAENHGGKRIPEVQI